MEREITWGYERGAAPVLPYMLLISSTISCFFMWSNQASGKLEKSTE